MDFEKLELVALEIFAAIVSRNHDHGDIERHAKDAFELAKVWLKAVEVEKKKN